MESMIIFFVVVGFAFGALGWIVWPVVFGAPITAWIYDFFISSDGKVKKDNANLVTDTIDPIVQRQLRESLDYEGPGGH